MTKPIIIYVDRLPWWRRARLWFLDLVERAPRIGSRENPVSTIDEALAVATLRSREDEKVPRVLLRIEPGVYRDNIVAQDPEDA